MCPYRQYLTLVMLPPAVAGSAPEHTARAPRPVPTQALSASARRLTDLGILVGYPDGSAKADQVMTRYEFATAWARLADRLGLATAAVPLEGLVTDVFEEHWARDSVLALLDTDLLPVLAVHTADPMSWSKLPTPPETDAPVARFLLFRGDQPLLRGQLMAMVYRTFQATAKQGLVTPAPSLAQAPPMRFVVQSGVFVGFPDKQLRLYRPMVRSEFFAATARAARLWAEALSRSPRPAKEPVSPSPEAGTPGSGPSPP